MTPYQKRVAATAKTKAAFVGKPFKFGRFDCAQMVRRHLRHMGRPVKDAAKAGSYHSLKGAKRALEKLGYKSLIEMADAHFERIAPAAALPGDIIAIPGEDEIGTLQVAVGNGRTIGYAQDAEGAVIQQPLEYVAAWRVA